MKKIIIKMAILVIALTILFNILYIKPTNASTTTLSASNASVASGGSFKVTISSSLKLSSWSIAVTNNGGCTFSSVSGTDNAVISGATITDMNLNGITSLATYTFKAPTVTKDTKYTITFSATQMSDATVTEGDDSVANATCTATITVKAPAKTTNNSGSSNTSTSNTGSSSTSNSNSNSSSNSQSNSSTVEKTPTFTSVDNKTIYAKSDCNLRASWSTSSTATYIEKGTKLTLTGTSTETINEYVWYRVTYNGTTKYIASSLITYTKPEEKSNNKNLSSLKIKGIELTPEFNKNTTQYTATADGDVTELEVTAKAEDSKANVSVIGNKDLKEGENIIKIKVTAEDNTSRTYFVTVTVGEGTQDILSLSELKIGRVNFEESFKPDIYTYELPLNSYIEKLDITAIPNQEDAVVEITGNENLKAGKNMITILVTSADGSQTATYQIEVNVLEEAVEVAKETSMLTYILIGVAIAIVIIIIMIIIVSKINSKNKDFDYEDKYGEEEKEGLTANDLFDFDDKKEKATKSRGRHSAK